MRHKKDLRREIRKLDKEINGAKKELKYWIDFKNKGTLDLEFQTSLLKKELFDMKENYDIITGMNTIELIPV